MRLIQRRHALTTMLMAVVLLMPPMVRSQGMAPKPADYVGFGSETTGGQGGALLRVTTLADAGSGSLRWALEDMEGPRVVAFDIGGIIALNEQIEINGDVTVEGQSAPGGITITGARLRVVGDNVILRGLRIRPGDGPGMPAQSRDAISIGTPKRKVSGVVIDGNSLTWAIDETLSIWGDVEDVTISNNIIAEALDEAGHEKGGHSMGLLIGGGEVSRVTIMGNLLAHNRNRNPTIKNRSEQIEFVNNLVYNWGENGLQVDGGSLHVVGNAYVAGPDTVPRAPIRLGNSKSPEGAYYVAKNLGEATPQSLLEGAPVFRGSGIEIAPATEVESHVLAHAGARHPALDAIDQRIVESVVTRTGRIIDSQDEVGGFNLLREGTASPEPKDGTPTGTENKVGKAPRSAETATQF